MKRGIISADPGLSNRYRAEASETSVIPIAIRTAQERLPCVGEAPREILAE